MHADSVVDDLDLYAPTAAVRSIKLRQMASGSVLSTTGEGNKLHAAKSEHLRSILDDNSGRPVMVFFEFLSDYQAICEVAGYEVPALYGRTTANAAAQAVRDWNAGRLPLFALHPRSAAYGLNLQDSGNVVVWYTVPWSYEMLNQGTARLWRQGQKHNVTSHYLLIEATIDEQVYARVGERADTHARVMRALL
jgi:SNF2 family DNA or RNA helicase